VAANRIWLSGTVVIGWPDNQSNGLNTVRNHTPVYLFDQTHHLLWLSYTKHMGASLITVPLVAQSYN
jgi:hypothetical protein